MNVYIKRMHMTLYIHISIKCMPKDWHIIYRHFEIAVKTAILK